MREMHFRTICDYKMKTDSPATFFESSDPNLPWSLCTACNRRSWIGHFIATDRGGFVSRIDLHDHGERARFASRSPMFRLFVRSYGAHVWDCEMSTMEFEFRQVTKSYAAETAKKFSCLHIVVGCPWFFRISAFGPGLPRGKTSNSA